MKRTIAILFIAAICAFGADVSGKYSGTIPNGDSIFLIFKQAGNTLTGSGGPNEQEQFPMRNGKLEGDKITCEIVAGEDRVFKLSFTVKGDTIEGEGTGPKGVTLPLKLTKVKS
jgi:hypothetical protein